MESSLHQQLKKHYGRDGQIEVALGEYRIDAIRDHELIEVQCASLSAIRKKCRVLLEDHSLRVVKPIAVRTRIAKCKSKKGKIVSRRLSPKRGSILELFEEMVYFHGVFPHPNLVLEIPLLHVEQKRIPCKKKNWRKRQDYQVADVQLERIDSSVEIHTAQDLIDILRLPDQLDRFDTSSLAKAIDRPRWYAQQVAYVLKHTGAIKQVDRKREGIIYQRTA